MQNAGHIVDSLSRRQMENEEKFLNKFSLRKFTVPKEKLRNQTRRQTNPKSEDTKDTKKTNEEKNRTDSDPKNVTLHPKRVHLEYRDLSKVLTANVPWWLQTKGVERNLKGEKLVTLVEDAAEEHNTTKTRLLAGCNSKLINNNQYNNKDDINYVLSEALKPYTQWQDTVKPSASSKKTINDTAILNAVTNTAGENDSCEVDEVSWIEQRLDKVQCILFDLAKSRLFSGCENCQKMQLPYLPLDGCYNAPLTREVLRSINEEQRSSITDAIIPPVNRQQNNAQNRTETFIENGTENGRHREIKCEQRNSIANGTQNDTYNDKRNSIKSETANYGTQNGTRNSLVNGKQQNDICNEKRNSIKSEAANGTRNGVVNGTQKDTANEKRNNIKSETANGIQNGTRNSLVNGKQNGTYNNERNSIKYKAANGTQNDTYKEKRNSIKYETLNGTRNSAGNGTQNEKYSEKKNNMKYMTQNEMLNGNQNKSQSVTHNKRNSNPNDIPDIPETVANTSQITDDSLESCSDYVSNLNVVNVEIDGLCSYMHKMIERDAVTDPNLLRSIIMRLQEVREVLSEFTMKILSYCSEDHLATQAQLEKIQPQCESARPTYVDYNTSMSAETRKIAYRNGMEPHSYASGSNGKSSPQVAADLRFRPEQNISSGRLRRIISSDMACYYCGTVPKSDGDQKRKEVRRSKLLNEVCSKTCLLPFKTMQNILKDKFDNDKEQEKTKQSVSNISEDEAKVNLDTKETQTDLGSSCTSICEKMMTNKGEKETVEENWKEDETVSTTQREERVGSTTRQNSGEEITKTERYLKEVKELDKKIKNLEASLRQAGNDTTRNTPEQINPRSNVDDEEIEAVKYFCKLENEKREIDTQTDDTAFEGLPTTYDNMSQWRDSAPSEKHRNELPVQIEDGNIPLSRMSSYVSQISDVCTCLCSLASSTVPLSKITCPHLKEIAVCHKCAERNFRNLGGCQLPKICNTCDNVPIIESDLTTEIEKRIGGEKRNSIFLKFTIVDNGIYHIQISNKSNTHLGCLFATEEATIEARNSKGFDGFVTLSVLNPINTPSQIESLVDHAFMVVQHENRTSK